MSSTAPRDFWDKMGDERPDEANPAVAIRPRDDRSERLPPRRRRPLRALFRFLLAVGIGVAGTAPAPATPTTVGSAAPVATADQQQLAAVSRSLADVRRKVEELAAQVASSQQQMAGDIARLQASDQDIFAKLAAPPPRPAPRPAPPHKPAPLALEPAAPPA